MKILGSAQQSIQSPLYKKPAAQPAAQPGKPQQALEGNTAGAAGQSAALPAKGKLNIPRDYQPKLGLDKKEQQFFEQIFPKARKEIRAYVDQQQKTFTEKGQIIDIRG